MAELDYSTLVAQQRDYFLAGNTRPVSWRKAQLEVLKAMFTEHHDEPRSIPACATRRTRSTPSSARLKAK